MKVSQTDLNKAALSGKAKVVSTAAKKKAKKKATPKARAPAQGTPPPSPVQSDPKMAEAIMAVASGVADSTQAVRSMAEEIRASLDVRRAQPVKFTISRDKNKLMKTVIAEPQGD